MWQAFEEKLRKEIPSLAGSALDWKRLKEVTRSKNIKEPYNLQVVSLRDMVLLHCNVSRKHVLYCNIFR